MGAPSFLTELGREPLDFDVLRGGQEVFLEGGQQLELAVAVGAGGGEEAGGVGDYRVNPLPVG